MKKALILFLFLPVMLSAGSRDSLNMAVKLSLSSPIDIFYFPTINAGIEHHLVKNSSVSAGFGYELYGFKNGDTSFVNPYGYKASLEYRYYFHSRRKAHEHSSQLTGAFIGLNGIYRKNQYNQTVKYTIPGDSSAIYSDSFWAEKKAIGGNLIFGYQLAPARHLVLDLFGGPGLTWREVKNHELNFTSINGATIEGTDLVPFFVSQDLETSSGAQVSFCLGFHVGYIIY